MKNNINERQATRRSVLRQIAVGTAMTAVPAFGQMPQLCHIATDTSAASPPAYQYRFFSPDQVQALELLTELIIPTDDHSLGAKAAGVPQYLDIIVSGGSDELKARWANGVADINDFAQQRFHRSFAAIQAPQQIELLEELASNEDRPESNLEHFFVILKRATIEGFYTSRIGIHQELEYQGNAALPAFPGCTHAEHSEPQGGQA